MRTLGLLLVVASTEDCPKCQAQRTYDMILEATQAPMSVYS